MAFLLIAGEFWHMRHTLKEPAVLNNTPRPKWITDKMIADVREQYSLYSAVPVELTEQEAIDALTSMSRLTGVIPVERSGDLSESSPEANGHE